MKKNQFEEAVRNKGFQKIAGVDEAGRGPLAGPVVAAACILPESLIVDEIDDSKRLKAEKREELYHFLISHPDVVCSIGIVEVDTIDEKNILRASLEAMSHAIDYLAVDPDYVLIDGTHLPDTNIHAQAIVGGDHLSQSIAAASILAKHTRDQVMMNYHRKWPEYAFHEHKGYGTKKHLEALKKYGPSPIHRLTFEPVKSMASNLKCVMA